MTITSGFSPPPFLGEGPMDCTLHSEAWECPAWRILASVKRMLEKPFPQKGMCRGLDPSGWGELVLLVSYSWVLIIFYHKGPREDTTKMESLTYKFSVAFIFSLQLGKTLPWGPSQRTLTCFHRIFLRGGVLAWKKRKYARMTGSRTQIMTISWTPTPAHIFSRPALPCPQAC